MNLSDARFLKPTKLLSLLSKGYGALRAPELRRGPAPQRKWAPLEPMEPRLLLSAELFVGAGAAAQDLTVRQQQLGDAAYVQVVNNADQSVVIQGLASDVSAVHVQGSALADRVTINLRSGLAVPVMVNDTQAADGDTLAVLADVAQWTLTGLDAGDVNAAVSFSGIENLLGGVDNEDGFSFGATGGVSGVLDGGAGGFDSITLSGGAFDQVDFIATGLQSGSIARDGNIIHYTNFEPIIDATVGGGRTFTSNTGVADVIRVRDIGLPGDSRMVISINTAEDVIFTDAGAITALTISAGPGADAIFLERLDSQFLGSITVNADSDDDSIHFAGFQPLANVTVDGGAGAFDAVHFVSDAPITLADVALDAATLANVERGYMSGPSLTANAFNGQVFFTANSPQWVEQGPAGYDNLLNGSTEIWDPVSGAIQAIAVHPTDRFTVFIGSTNGGIWRNTGGTEVFFATAESALTADDQVTLNAFANFLEANPHLSVEVAGHTDSAGDPADNLTLSGARATSVINYLVNTRLIEASRLTKTFFGETLPVAANGLSGNQLLNRRVELLVKNWEPLTDDMPSLSIGALAFSPTNPQVIYAGTARTSSFGSQGGDQIGLLHSNDGGDTWRVIGAQEFADLTITQVTPTHFTGILGGELVFVTTFDVDRDGDGNVDDAGGVFEVEVLADGTAFVEKISGAPLATGLPAGHYTDAVFDPGSLGPARSAGVYAASPTLGIFKLTAGVAGWLPVSSVATGFTLGDSELVGPGFGVDDVLQNTTRIELAIHEGTGTLYAGVLGPVNSNGMLDMAGDRFGLLSVFKTSNGGALWADLQAPFSVDGAVTFGTHPGRQGDIHFSIVVDPTNANIVYVGGDRQPVTTNNAVGLTDFAGRTFRFDPGTFSWVQLQGTGANGTGQHADSRGLVFTSDFTLLEINDGGLYRLQNPRGELNQGTTQWASLNRGLGIIETLDLAFDTLNGTIQLGAQDNGSAHQTGSVDGLDNDGDGQVDESDERLIWNGTTAGDGNFQIAIPFDSDNNGSLDHTLRYSLSNNFNFLNVYEFDSAGNQVNADSADVDAVLGNTNSWRIGFRTGAGAAFLSGIGGNDSKLGFDRIPMALNRFDNTRVLIGHNALYESANVNFSNSAARVLPLEQVTRLDPAVGTAFGRGMQVRSMVYGGRTAGADDADVVLVSRHNQIHFRSDPAAAFTVVAVPGAGAISDIEVDPENWKTVYVVDDTDVFRINDITAAGGVWTRITGNLGSLSQERMLSIEYVKDGGPDVLLVGGDGGVSRLLAPDTATAANATWATFGSGLPNTLVIDLEYVDVDATGTVSASDVLLAGTQGRGAWSITGAALLGLGETSELRILGSTTNPAGDDLLLRLDEANPLFVNVFDLDQSNVEPVYRSLASGYDLFAVDTRAGDDTVTVDHVNGAVSVPGGIHYDGGADSNTLVLQGGAVTQLSSETLPGDDRHTVVDLHGRKQIVFTDANVGIINAAAIPSPLAEALKTLEGAMKSLVDLDGLLSGLTLNMPGLGESLGRALDGIDFEGPAPVSTPGAGAPSQMQQVLDASSQVLGLLRRFIETGTGAIDLDALSDFASLEALRLAFENLDESGSGSVAASGDLVLGFELTMAGVKKTLGGRADLDLSLLGGSIDIEGFVDVHADVEMNLVFGVDGTHGFYIKSNAADDIVIDNIRIDASDDATATGQFGFLGVNLTQAVLTMDADVQLRVDIEESGGDGYIEFLELAGDVAGYVDVELVGDPGDSVKDVQLTGTFGVTALLPGQAAPFSLVDARATIAWEDIGLAANLLNEGPNVTVSAAVGAGTGAAALLNFLQLNTQTIVDRLTTFQAQLDAVLGVEIPYLSDGIAQIVAFANAFQTKIIDPLTSGIGGSASIPTIQSLVSRLAAELGVSPAAMGLAYDAASTELTYHVALEHTLLNVTRSLGAGVDLLGGLADLQFSTDATVSATVALDTVIGIDLGGLVALDNPLDWFFIKNPSATAAVSVLATDVQARARFGFLSIGVDEGTLETTTPISLVATLNDTGTNAADGRIDLRELIDGLDNLGDLVSLDVQGGLHLFLPVEAPFLGLADVVPPVAADYANAITVDFPDIGEPSSATVTFGSGLTELKNFANIDASSIVSLLGQLTAFLDDFRNSPQFANFDVPLVGPALDKVLGFADALRDKLLIDDKDDALDNATTLLYDINKALDGAGLAGVLRAEKDPALNRIRLIANDAGVPFTLTTVTGTELGFTAGQASAGMVFQSVTGSNNVAVNGQFVLDDVTLGISVDGSPAKNVLVRKSDTTQNTRIGNDVWKLVDAQNAATFSTVQEMVLKLTEIFGINVLTYTPANDELTFTFSVAEVFGQADIAFDSALQGLPEYLSLETGGTLRIVADGSLNLTLGVSLGEADASTKLDGTELLADLSGGIAISNALRINGTGDVRTVYGQLSGDAHFTLNVTGDPAIVAPVDVAVLMSNAANNTTVANLVSDLNSALAAAGLAGKIVAQAAGAQVELVEAVGAVLTGFSLSAISSDAAVKDIGLPTAKTATVDAADATLKVKATKDVPPLRGRLTGDAAFTLALNTVPAPLAVTVPAAGTSTNRYAFDIINDIHAQITFASHPQWFFPSTDPITSEPINARRVEFGFSNGKLTATAKDGAASFNLSTANAVAQTDLGLPASASGSLADLTITTRDGATSTVSFAGAVTLQDAIGQIFADTGGKVTASIDDDETGLLLSDNTFAGGGAGTFAVTLANNSTAGLGLGIVGTDKASDADSADGKIEGSPIAGVRPLDRFFIKATPVGQAPLANLGVDVSTPTPLTASAQFGFVGLELVGAGALPSGKAIEADLTLRLLEPAGSSDGNVSLTELLAAIGDIGSIFDISLTGAGAVDLSLAAPQIAALANELGINVDAGARISITANLGDPFADTPILPTLQFDFPNFGELLDFGNVDLSFASIIDGLQALAAFLDQFEAFEFLNDPLPIIDLSINDLISVADKFATAVDEAQNNPAGTVQLLEDKLKEAFGIPKASNLLNLVLYTDDMNTPGNSSDDVHILKVELELSAGFDESLALDLDLAELAGLPDALNLAGSANLQAAGSVALKLDFGFDVANPLDIYVFNTTGIVGDILAQGTDLSFQAAIGPAGVFVKGGTASVHANAQLGMPQAVFTANKPQPAANDDRMFIVDFLSNLGDLGFKVPVVAEANATLPVYFPTQSIFAGNITLLDWDFLTTEPIPFNIPADLLSIDPSDFSILDQLLLGVDGIDLFLEGLQDILDGEIGGITLPLIGDKLAGAADVIGDFRDGFLEDFRTVVTELANPANAFNAGGVNGPNNPAQPDPISKMLFELLGPGGLDLLLDSPGGNSTVDVFDITYTSNISDPEAEPSELFLDWDFRLGTTLLNAGAGINMDIGIPGLGLETRGDVNLDISWELTLGFGLNSDDGFYIDVSDGSELQITADLTVPGGGITGTLGFLQLDAEDKGDTHLGVTLGVNVFNRNNPSDAKLGFTELGKLGLDIGIAAEAVVDLGMRLSLSSDLVPNAATNFPSLVADFRLEWGIGNFGASTLVPLGELDGSFLKNGLRFVGFDRVGLDMGSYFSDLIGPIVAKVQEITEPIKPFLDFLTEPIPIISQLAGPTSLLDLAEMTGFLNPGIIKAIEIVDQVIDIAHAMANIGPNVVLYFDDFLPAGLILVNNPSGAPGGGIPDFSNPNLDIEQLADDLLAGPLLDWLPSEISGPLGDITDEVADSVSKMLPGGSAAEGFSLPIIEDPSQIFGMLMGKDADLVKFTMAPLEFGAEFSAFFSVLGPLGVSINAEASATFGPFTFGYDTAGIRGFANSGWRNPLALFDGLYVGDTINGVDVPELQFDARVFAAAELNLVVARGGVAGGLRAEIDFDLHDPDKDGKVRIKELVTNVLNEFKYGTPALSPLAVFDITGKLTAELFAFVYVDLLLFSIDEEWYITDPIVLLDFESDFIRVPTLATELGEGVLQLNMGKASEQRIEGDLSDFGETFIVTQKDADEVWVWSPLVDFNHSGTNDNNEAQPYKATSTILAVGGEGNDTIDLSGVTANLKFELEGNVGDDIIKAGSGTGAAKILGGSGNDELWGGGGADNIFGETGDDEIHGGGGADWLFGDGKPKDDIVGNVITVTMKPSDGADSIYGDAGTDFIIGGGGADTAEGGADADVLVGDAVKATMNGRIVVSVSDTAKGAGGFKDNLKGDGGEDRIWGGKGNDTLAGGADADTIYGEQGFDLIDGDGGDDTLFGGDDNDTINGGADDDTAYGDAGADIINGGGSDDTLYGGTGADTMHGDGGADMIFGNADPDKIFGDAGQDYLEGGGGDDVVKGGADQDTLVAGYGSDTLDGGAASDQYFIEARGGATTELTTAYDSGGVVGTDIFTFLGTGEGDVVLLRAMADSYFPLEAKLLGLIAKVFNSGEADKLAAMKQAINDAYGPHDVPVGMLADLVAAYFAGKGNELQQAVQDTHVLVLGGPTAQQVKDVVGAAYAALPNVIQIGGKMIATLRAVKTLYEGLSLEAPEAMLEAITAVYTELTASLNSLLIAISDKYQPEPIPAGETAAVNTAFVALINNGGKFVERFNYRHMEGLAVNTLGGNDYIVTDDVLAATTINAGLGDDRIQVGQVFRSERVGDEDGNDSSTTIGDDPSELITGIRAEDVFTTIEITRGWLSNGVSVPTTINGEGGNDNFTVFRNVAVLNLNGGDGDDVFTVRAFALKGSTDSERARTDMKGDAGADTILYAVNAPVGIDGGDGFDTVRIVGTEFSDDFVVTDGGVFGAGLNVSYVNIEKLVADGAEGNDRYFVYSTGLEVVTEIDGGLGSDSFFIGGNPSRSPVNVVSNDLRGHSGIILHSVESTLDGSLWDGLPVEGLSANVGDGSEDMIMVTEQGARSTVFEGVAYAANLAGLAFDSYSVRLTRSPNPGTNARINVVPSAMTPEDVFKSYEDLEFLMPGANPAVDLNWVSYLSLPQLLFTEANWNAEQTVTFRAVDDAASEGKRIIFINHNLENSSDPEYADTQMLSVKVFMDDNDQDAVLVRPTDRTHVVLENGFTDEFTVALTKAPLFDVVVTMSVLNADIALSGATLGAGNTLTFTPADWFTPQLITVTAVNDAIREGFHTDYVSFSVASDDIAETKQPVPNPIQIDGNISLPGIQDIPPDKPTSTLFMPFRPLPNTTTVWIDSGSGNQQLAANRFTVSGSTLSFFTAAGTPEKRIGKVTAQFNYNEPGYDATEVRDIVVDVYDNDSPAVIIEQTDGSTDTIEDDADLPPVDGLKDSAKTDSYRIRLSQAPAVGETVIITADAFLTRTTYAGTTHFAEQVTVNGLSATALVFTLANWNLWQTVTVAAINDEFLDGNDTQAFAPDLQTVNKIRGPLIVDGAAGDGSLSLPAPLMMPWELNIRESSGAVLSFTPNLEDGPGAIETMVVSKAELQAVVDLLGIDDVDIDALADLEGKTLEMTKGPGVGVKLDPIGRPLDLYDRFWLILNVAPSNVPGSDLVTLTLKNPSAVDPAVLGLAGAPVATTPAKPVEYAITNLSINFFADEREQVDYLFVYDNDSVADDVGALTSSDGSVRVFNGTQMTVETSALVRTIGLLGLADVSLLAGRSIEITVGPGTGRSWVIGSVGNVLNNPDLKVINLTSPSAGAELPTNRSEFRIEGADRYGRITGFGMGPNIIFSGRPQPGGITYGDIEVVEMYLGTGDDKVRVDYVSHSDDHATQRNGVFATLMLLDTGKGNDEVTVKLKDGQDGLLSLGLGAGNDTVLDTGSTRGNVIFGDVGNDTINTGAGNDIVFGDIGRVDYVDDKGEIITRLGHSQPRNIINPELDSAANIVQQVGNFGILRGTLTDADANFATDHGGLAGLMMQAISADGHVQFQRIISNTADTLTLAGPWKVGYAGLGDPKLGFIAYRISVFPEDQTDGVERGPRIAWSIEEALGGVDVINGGDGRDILIGGASTDTIHGNGGGDWIVGDDGRFDFLPTDRGLDDGPTELTRILVAPVATGDDHLFGDAEADLIVGGFGVDNIQGGAADDLLVGDAVVVTFAPGNLAIEIETLLNGNALNGADVMSGGAGNDLAIGGGKGDTIDGDAGNDMLVGDAAKVLRNAGGLTQVETIDRAIGGIDIIRGGADDDVVIGGALGDQLDGSTDDDLIFGDNVLLVFNLNSGDAITPRLRNLLLATSPIYLNGVPQIGTRQNLPGGNPAWADWTMTLDQTETAGNFGDDNIAGGAQADAIFGQRGNDTIQGDGSITIVVTDGTSEEAASDGDDYIEGNAGNDMLFGNLGQDDLIGGSSTLFSLGDVNPGDRRALRDDGVDTIFGGAGTDLLRNNYGDGSHGRDADMILGDNGNIYRLITGGAYYGFNYDNLYNGDVPIIVRAAELKDYTLGNLTVSLDPDTGDAGTGDILHGESGDDFIYGMTGNDVIFGEGQDDDIIGGTGHDWISGGTGDDGVLGDDGRILTSRNSLAEPLNGVATGVGQASISTPGNIQQATLNALNTLLKAVDLTPFNVAPTSAQMLYDAPNADDIIFGGLGNDFLHGGSGDDAMSGAEAMPAVYSAPVNAGDVLQYSSLRGEFAAYVEYEPMRRLANFVLNFSATEGPQLAGLGTATTADDFFTDGEDKLFGDLGNDWLVGGTGRDNHYGGWGDDLMNADDNQGVGTEPNTTPDTHTSYEDRAFGGAGRDVLIGNTGGDRLIDWSGEFNSYLVPFAPFGLATVSRALQPQLPEFLYALSKADGADQTINQGAGTARNGEPYAELGLVRQQDPDWQAQTGAPADPQAGNVPGGPRDVLRAASFNDGAMQALAPDSGTWQVSSGTLQVDAASNKADAVAVYQVGDALPSYYEVLATIKIVKPTAGWDANSYVVFDYQSPTSFRFAGVNAATNKLEIGQRTAAGWQVLKSTFVPGSVKSDSWYNIMLSINGLTATVTLDNSTSLSQVFAPTVVDGFAYGLNWGLVGFGSNKSRGAMDNIAVQIVPPASNITRTDDFAAGKGVMLTAVANSSIGNWVANAGRVNATAVAPADTAIQMLNLGGVTQLKTTSLLELSTTFNTAGRAGIVFDRYSDTDFKFAAVDVVSKQVMIGHRTAAGWFIDAVQAKSTLAAGVDVKLGLVVRGASVSVTLNDQAAVGFVFNAVAVDGRFGLFTKGAAASFDAVTVKTNDASVPAAQEAALSSDTVTVAGATALNDAQLAALASEARARWARVEDASHVALLDTLEIVIADLPGTQLGEYTAGRITIDVDAAGQGWFVDATPADDREFSGRGSLITARINGGAAGQMDLLSVLSHEMGHAMGLGHAGGGVMSDALQAGQRATPERWGLGQSSIDDALLRGRHGAATPAEMPAIEWAAVGDAERQRQEPARVNAKATAWQERFVNSLGQSAERSNPNAALRVQLNASSSVAGKLNRL